MRAVPGIEEAAHTTWSRLVTMSLIFVIGATNAGKSTLISAAKEVGCGTVEVGKMMRAKYPPEYFQGQAAPTKTQGEAMQMMMDGIEQVRAQGPGMCLDCQGKGYLSGFGTTTGLLCQCRCSGTGVAVRHLCFIDGQPRAMEQFRVCIALRDQGYPIAFCHLWAPLADREARARQRDSSDPAKLALSLSRLQGDMPVLYDITAELMQRPTIPHEVWDTTQATYNPMSVVRALAEKTDKP